MRGPHVALVLGALVLVALAGAWLWLAHPRPVLPPPVEPEFVCGGARLRLGGEPGGEPEVRVRLDDGPERRWFVVRRPAGRLTLRAGAGPTRAAVGVDEGAEGALSLRCEQQRARVAWEGPGEGGLVLATAEAPTLVFVPGGAPQGGERKADFAVVAWGERAAVLGAGKFVWRDFPARFEASAAEAWITPSEAAGAVARGFGPGARRLRGHMEPPAAGAPVVALDAEGGLGAATVTDARGGFELASAGALSAAYAAVGASRAGPAVAAGGEGELVVAAPGTGAVRVRVRDQDTGQALPARVVVHGHEGTREPNLGPPHRASGAGPLIDAEEGQARLVVRAGRYRVLATRGPEYTVDEAVTEVTAGGEAEVELLLRRVVDTPGWAGCDLHVHSRGSFDSMVSLDDRVRSLMAAGIDFALPSEHNRIGSYDAVQVAGQGKWLTWVPAVEVTTVDPSGGHFNVFPYGAAKAPRYKRTGLRAVIDYVRRESPGSLVQVNHPRMGRIGHFNALHIDPQTQRGLELLARGFDLLEIYNGFDLGNAARVEQDAVEWMRMLERGRIHWATGNSDSHAVQYVGVGYPRTYAGVSSDHDGGEGAGLDVAGLVEGLRRGKALTTSGPFVEVRQGERGPGEPLSVSEGKARVRLRVRSAPWLDVSEVEVFVGAQSVLKRELGSRAPEVGRSAGTLEEARARAVRFDEEVEVAVGPEAKALVVVARGKRRAGEVLPFLDWTPLAIVNPMLVEAR